MSAVIPPVLGAGLSQDAIDRQVEALAAYLSRGGSASQWFDSKDLAPADRARVLVALGDLRDDDTQRERRHA